MKRPNELYMRLAIHLSGDHNKSNFTSYVNASSRI